MADPRGRPGRDESDYTLTFSTTTRTAVDTFTRNGQRYRLEYAVTGEQSSG